MRKNLDMKHFRKYIVKIAAWLAIGIVMFTMVSYFASTKEALFAAVLNATLFMAIVLINEYWLFSKFYMTNRRRFIILNTTASISFAVVILLLEHFFGSHKPNREENLPYIFPIMRALTMIAFVNFISITLLLAKALKNNAENEKKLKEEKLGTEIKLLKAQINPHFIFNALNNIYSLTYTKTDNAPDSVLKLSEMLRYVFYDCSNDQVKLLGEVDYISNFIAFQQMKSEHEQNIQFDFTGIKKDLDVSPMIFIPFIENAFKYSKIEEYSDAYVKISISTEADSLIFDIMNTMPSQGKALSGNGLGIKNVKQRLNLLYPDKYYLQIEENESSYSVNLKINVL